VVAESATNPRERFDAKNCVPAGRRILIGLGNALLILALDGKAALALNPMPAFGFTSAANPVPLPKTKPRAVRKHFVVLSIGSREVARAQRSSVRHCEDALKTFDFGNCLLRVHSISISNIVVAIVKRSGICVSCLRVRPAPRGDLAAAFLCRIPHSDVYPSLVCWFESVCVPPNEARRQFRPSRLPDYAA